MDHTDQLKILNTEKSIILNRITENPDNEVIINNSKKAIEVINDKISALQS